MDAIGPAENGAAEPAISNPLDCFASASAKDPLTLSLSPLGRGGPIIAHPVIASQKRPLTPALSREGRGGRPCPLIGRSPLPSRERGQGEGGLCDPINRFRYRCGRLHLHVPPSASLGGYS